MQGGFFDDFVKEMFTLEEIVGVFIPIDSSKNDEPQKAEIKIFEKLGWIDILINAHGGFYSYDNLIYLA